MKRTRFLLVIGLNGVVVFEFGFSLRVIVRGGFKPWICRIINVLPGQPRPRG